MMTPTKDKPRPELEFPPRFGRPKTLEALGERNDASTHTQRFFYWYPK
jgi:hypothetical protein